MPATVIDNPPGISLALPDGTTAIRYVETPNPGLVRTLLIGLAGLVHPHGNVDAASAIGGYLAAARRTTRELAEQGFTGPAGDLSRARLAGYWMAAARPRDEARVRAMLRSADNLHPVLRPDVRGLVDGRPYTRSRAGDTRHLAPYSESEWRRLISACQSITGSSYAAHRKALAVAGAGQDPLVHGWTPGNAQWLLRYRGPDEARPRMREVTADGGRPHRMGFPMGLRLCGADLYPDTKVVIAYRLLFGTYTGIVPDGIRNLGLGDIEWAGDATILLSYIKGRTSKESRTLSRPATRLLEQWLDHSALTRAFAPPEMLDGLWVRMNPHGSQRWTVKKEDNETLRRWVAVNGVLGDDGEPLKIHLHRIRTTHDALSAHPQWKGSRRSVIDPNRSPQAEGDSYLSVTTREQQLAAEEVIASAQGDMLRRARPLLVLRDEQLAGLLASYPGRVAALGLDDMALRELVAGPRDVFTAACADQLSGLHGPEGKPCPARPWVCLLCPLALFAPRHLPNLMRLRAFFSRQWNNMPGSHFMSVFGPYSQRLDDLLQPGTYFPEHALDQAARQVTGTDGELPLRPEELTS